jgi:hypothetical protein
MFIVGSLFVLIGWSVRTSGDKDAFVKGLMFQLVGAIGILGAFAFGVVMYGEYRAARKALATHNYSVVEGTVSNFVPMPPGGHSTESFVVNGVHFAYGSGWGSTTFNSEWNKGFIHNGVEVRVTYVDGDIIRVEVK